MVTPDRAVAVPLTVRVPSTDSAVAGPRVRELEAATVAVRVSWAAAAQAIVPCTLPPAMVTLAPPPPATARLAALLVISAELSTLNEPLPTTLTVPDHDRELSDNGVPRVKVLEPVAPSA